MTLVLKFSNYLPIEIPDFHLTPRSYTNEYIKQMGSLRAKRCKKFRELAFYRDIFFFNSLLLGTHSSLSWVGNGVLNGSARSFSPNPIYIFDFCWHTVCNTVLYQPLNNWVIYFVPIVISFILFHITMIYLNEIGLIQSETTIVVSDTMDIQSDLWILMAWCFSTRSLVATVLSTHPSVSSCYGLNYVSRLI